MSAFHLAILGCGRIARTHARTARALGVAVSFASRSLAKAEAYRAKYGGRRGFGSYQDACAAAEVEAVLDCTPPSQHVANARMAAAHGKAMLIEKPVARSLDELDVIARAAADAKIPAMVAENYHFKPLLAVLRHHLERRDIGDPLFLELVRANRSRPGGWRADAAEMGGGALLEGGVHWVNLLLNLGGKPKAVAATKPERPYDMNAPLEDGIDLLVKFESGAAGRLLHTWNAANRIGGLSRSRIIGTEGNIHFESNGVWVLVAGRRWRLRFPGFRDLMGYRAMLAHFVQAVERGEAPAMSLDAARRDLAFVMAAYRSLDTGRFETV